MIFLWFADGRVLEPESYNASGIIAVVLVIIVMIAGAFLILIIVFAV